MPILVTGAHRSGTTWLGHLLSLGGSTRYVQEPLNLNFKPWWMPEIDYWYQFIPSDSPLWLSLDAAVYGRFSLQSAVAQRPLWPAAARALCDALLAVGGPGRRRAIVKDPFMLFNVEEFETRYEGIVVLTVRHPVAFVSSVCRQEWSFDFSNLAYQQPIMDGALAPWGREIERATRWAPESMLEQACLLWRVVYGHVSVLARNPNRVLVLHEELARDVSRRLPILYRRLGLNWGRHVERRLSGLVYGDSHPGTGVNEIRRDSASVADEWKTRVAASEVQRILELTMPEAQAFFPQDYQ